MGVACDMWDRHRWLSDSRMAHMTSSDEPRKPVEVDLDAEEASIPEGRTCPVCGPTLPEQERHKADFHSFDLMMRHWEKMHPRMAPGGVSLGIRAGGRGPTYLDMMIKRPIDHEDEASLDAWIQNESVHPHEALDLWRALTLPEH
jgi:hypothetical protein